MTEPELILQVEDMRADVWAGETFEVVEGRILAYLGAKRCIHGKTLRWAPMQHVDGSPLAWHPTYCAACDFETWVMARRPSDRPRPV